MLISLETIHQNISEMYPVLLKYWCSLALFKALHPVWYVFPCGFILFPLGLVALNKEAYSRLKQYQMQKTELDSKTVASLFFSRWSWHWNQVPAVNTEAYIFGDLSLKIASILENLSLLPEIMSPIFDGLESLSRLNNSKSNKRKNSQDKNTNAKLEASFYQDYDLMEDILFEFKTATAK
ncbi:conserved hypothetical transmembrane protein [Kluyveromyces marxianus]|uniref:Conserved hypothetical transmembrane protein n=2 Tax=Kluyveromyces marxianus TaxID=4911 RepID=W0T8I9_KLUMD|nr:conserved hypothetical transmembrane protein [Kluyveromyces marxianus DMKU3-1042]QGN15650.1 conserved hypothetical transmembrane protein [Kluyveromyces marxianus]BAO39937.1 conserved hypothetical transmembrane protein [Kluyveromyces marxianus DMKU3-1042]